MTVVSCTQRFDDLGQSGAGVGAPVVGDAVPDTGHQHRVPCDPFDVEHADRSAEVTGGDRSALPQGPDAVIETDPVVPQRIPDGFGDRCHVTRADRPPVVDQDQVVVAQWSGVAAAEAADCGERDAVRGAVAVGLGGGVPQVREHGLGVGAEPLPSDRSGTGLMERPGVGQIEALGRVVVAHVPSLPEASVHRVARAGGRGPPGGLTRLLRRVRRCARGRRPRPA